MKSEDLNKLCLVISKLADIYGQKITNKIMTYYWNILENFTLTEILFACRSHIYSRHGNFMPKPFDIVKKILEITVITSNSKQRGIKDESTLHGISRKSTLRVG